MRTFKLLSRDAKRTSIAVALLATVVQVLTIGAMFQLAGGGTLA